MRGKAGRERRLAQVEAVSLSGRRVGPVEARVNGDIGGTIRRHGRRRRPGQRVDGRRRPAFVGTHVYVGRDARTGVGHPRIIVAAPAEDVGRGGADAVGRVDAGGARTELQPVVSRHPDAVRPIRIPGVHEQRIGVDVAGAAAAPALDAGIGRNGNRVGVVDDLMAAGSRVIPEDAVQQRDRVRRMRVADGPGLLYSMVAGEGAVDERWAGSAVHDGSAPVCPIVDEQAVFEAREHGAFVGVVVEDGTASAGVLQRRDVVVEDAVRDRRCRGVVGHPAGVRASGSVPENAVPNRRGSLRVEHIAADGREDAAFVVGHAVLNGKTIDYGAVVNAVRLDDMVRVLL